MTDVHEVDPADPEGAGSAIEAAAEAIERGLVVVFPTETVYGIGCRPDDPGATARLFEAKRRQAGLSLPVLAPDQGSAWRLGHRSAMAVALAEAFWPGPMTMVLPRTEASAAWDLGGHASTIGLRVPDHTLAEALMRRAGPLAATSANQSGRPPISDPAGLVGTFGDRVAVYLVLSPEGVLGGSPSTVVDVTGERPAVLREGAIGADRLREAVAGPGDKRTG
jgi:L-threonylcarbamoyladenylate synthase